MSKKLNWQVKAYRKKSRSWHIIKLSKNKKNAENFCKNIGKKSGIKCKVEKYKG